MPGTTTKGKNSNSDRVYNVNGRRTLLPSASLPPPLLRPCRLVSGQGASWCFGNNNDQSDSSCSTPFHLSKWTMARDSNLPPV